jgi:hypothetical protein
MRALRVRWERALAGPRGDASMIAPIYISGRRLEGRTRMPIDLETDLSRKLRGLELKLARATHRRSGSFEINTSRAAAPGRTRALYLDDGTVRFRMSLITRTADADVVHRQHGSLHGGLARHGEQLHQPEPGVLRLDRGDQRKCDLEEDRCRLDQQGDGQLRRDDDPASDSGGGCRSGGRHQLDGHGDRRQRRPSVADLLRYLQLTEMS